MKVVQRHMTPEDMAGMKECFLTGTAAEVTPVSRIGDYSFTPARPAGGLWTGRGSGRGRISI